MPPGDKRGNQSINQDRPVGRSSSSASPPRISRGPCANPRWPLLLKYDHPQSLRIPWDLSQNASFRQNLGIAGCVMPSGMKPNEVTENGGRAQDDFKLHFRAFIFAPGPGLQESSTPSNQTYCSSRSLRGKVRSVSPIDMALKVPIGLMRSFRVLSKPV